MYPHTATTEYSIVGIRYPRTRTRGVMQTPEKAVFVLQVRPTGPTGRFDLRAEVLQNAKLSARGTADYGPVAQGLPVLARGVDCLFVAVVVLCARAPYSVDDERKALALWPAAACRKRPSFQVSRRRPCPVCGPAPASAYGEPAKPQEAACETKAPAGSLLRLVDLCG
jgi:hypothetical protein